MSPKPTGARDHNSRAISASNQQTNESRSQSILVFIGIILGRLYDWGQYCTIHGTPGSNSNSCGNNQKSERNQHSSTEHTHTQTYRPRAQGHEIQETKYRMEAKHGHSRHPELPFCSVKLYRALESHLKLKLCFVCETGLNSLSKCSPCILACLRAGITSIHGTPSWIQGFVAQSHGGVDCPNLSSLPVNQQSYMAKRRYWMEHRFQQVKDNTLSVHGLAQSPLN